MCFVQKDVLDLGLKSAKRTVRNFGGSSKAKNAARNFIQLRSSGTLRYTLLVLVRAKLNAGSLHQKKNLKN